MALASLTLLLIATAQPQGTSSGAAQPIPRRPRPAGPQEDCNHNRIEDALDIQLGISLDCQGDGIPDECQLAPTGSYRYDDGAMDGSVGTVPRHVAWLTHHTVLPGQATITAIELAWGTMPNGTPATLCLWSDPDGDGDPRDARVLMSHLATAQLANTGIVVREDVPDTFIGPPGTSFFVGGWGEFEPAPVHFPAGLDDDSTVRESWWVTSDTPIDPDDLSSGAVFEYGLIGEFCPCNGDWMIRAISCNTGHCGESVDANGNGIPDECDPDCNDNGVPDDVDVANGTSTDCDGDMVPDECMLPDCDGNGIADLCQTLVAHGLAGEYYSNKRLEGSPMVRFDPEVLFDFTATPPFPGMFPTSHFSVRWTGSITSGPAGTYTFALNHDDGVRLWINGVLVVEDWNEGADMHSGTIDLAALTEYYVRLEYFQANGGALVELLWQPPGGVLAPVPSAALQPILDRDEDGIPDPCQFPDCNDNGVEDAVDILLGTAGDCDVNALPDSCQPCEDCDRNGLLDPCELAAGSGLVAQYWESIGGAGKFTNPLLTRIEPNVDFDWAGGSPTPGVPADEFAIRFSGTLTTPPITGTYRLHLQGDDGVRLWLDGVLLVDEWHPSSGNIYLRDVFLSGDSEHLLVLDYYEAGGNAVVRLHWTVPGSSEVPIPSSAFRPDTDLDDDSIPDLCQVDCDRNGVPDAVDLLLATHADGDADCVPDICNQGAGHWRFEELGGPIALDSTTNAQDGMLSVLPVRVTDVPVPMVPGTGASNTQALDLGWQDASTGGFIEVPDPNGFFALGGESFTLEAWVRLERLSSTVDANQRQWLFQKKPAASADGLLDYGFLCQAGNLGGSGRELAFVYGDGTSIQVVTSNLEISDLVWHHVSVAYDAGARKLRFGRDGAYQTVDLFRLGLASPGSLFIGAHENAFGVMNQFLRGRIDEPRISRRFVAPEDLLDSP